MAFNVVLYTFSKKSNSTAIPSTAALTVSCQARLPLDVISPTIQLQLTGGAAANPSAYNYAYIASFSRYYWVRTWRNVGPLWEADLQVDALASWRTNIGSQSCYVFRSSAAFNGQVADEIYPTTARQHRYNAAIPKVWTVNGANEAGAASGSGMFILGILNKTGTVYGAFTPAQLDTLLTYLFDGAFYDAVLSEFGATEYPEAKVAVNPLQFISSCKFVPIGMISSGYWGLRYVDQVFGISVGPVDVPATQGISWYRLNTSTVPLAGSFSIYDISITTDFLHPQSSVRGAWLNYSPYTSYELFYPPFGLIQLDPVEISSHANMRIRLTLDARTTTCMLEVQVYDTAADIRTIYRAEGSFGVDVPLSNVLQPGTSTVSMLRSTMGGLMGAAGSLMRGDILGAAGSLFGAFDAGAANAIKGQIPHVSTMGGPGSVSSLDGTPKLYVTHWYLADDDLADFGRPLCAIRTISAIPGFIRCDSDHVSIPCTSQELSEIRRVMASGFYYE